MRALVQHHALRPLRHGGIGDLGPRGLPGSGQVVEHLRRPDDREVGRLAHPQDLLLQLGEPLVTSLDGQVAPGDHHADPGRAHGVQQDLREAVEGRPGLDLQDQSQVLPPTRTEVVLHGVDVALVAEERQRDHVGVRRGHPEEGEIVIGHGGDRQIRLRQVDALLGPQLRAPRRGRLDAHDDVTGADPVHDSGELSVVQHDVLPRLRDVEDRGQGAADPGHPG